MSKFRFVLLACLVVVLALTVLVSACGGGTTTTSAPPATTATTASTPTTGGSTGSTSAPTPGGSTATTAAAAPVTLHIGGTFALTGAERILANARTENPASRRVLEKCGFAYIDSGLDLLPARGGLHACHRFQLTRKRWAASRFSPRLPKMAHQAPDSTAAILELEPQSQA